MKKYQIMSALAVAAMAALVSCEYDDSMTSQDGEQVTITASFPECPDSKIAFEEATSGLDLKWQKSDYLTIVGETTQKYAVETISEDGKTATFRGTAVKGDSFKVILSDRGVNYPTRGFSGQFNPNNLRYDAVLDGVQDYTKVSFTPEWAEANNATFSQTGVLMLHLQLPEGCTGVKYIKFVAPTNVFSSTNESDCDRLYYRAIGHSYADPEDGKLKAYWISSMNEDVIKAGTEISVILEATGANFVKDYTLTEDFHITPGKRNVLRLNSKNWQPVSLSNLSSNTCCAPYANVCDEDNGPARLLDGDTKTLWCYPWGNNCYVDVNFDDWTYYTTKEWGPTGDKNKMNAPMVCVVNMGTKRCLHTISLYTRTNNNPNTTTGEVWGSADTANDSDFEGKLLQTLNMNIGVGSNRGQWPLWRAKKWIKIGDFDFRTLTNEAGPNGLNGKNGRFDISAMGCPAKYLMIVVHEGVKGESGEVPDIAVSELVIKSYEPVNQ